VMPENTCGGLCAIVISSMYRILMHRIGCRLHAAPGPGLPASGNL